MLNGLAGGDLQDPVAIGGFELIAIEAVGEAEAATPRSVAELAEQGGCLITAAGFRALGADGEVAIGGLDVDGVAVDAGQFQPQGVAGFVVVDFGVGDAFCTGQLLVESLEQVEGRRMQGQHVEHSEE